MAMTLEEMGLPAVSLTGWQAGVGTDETYGDAHIRRLSMERVRRELDGGKVVLIAGFQGVSPGNDITTLGRGGSDTTAVAAAAALRADECRIYTDVEGVFTADPRLIPEARRLSAWTARKCSGSPRSARRCCTNAARRSRCALPSRSRCSPVLSPRQAPSSALCRCPRTKAVSPP